MQLAQLVYVAVLCGVAVAQTPSFFIVAPGSSETNPTKIFLNASQVYTVAVGSNVTLGCQYASDASWSTVIGKWSVVPANTAFFSLYVNGFASDDLRDIGKRYPSLTQRIRGGGLYAENVPTVVYLRLINIMQYDIGTYGCFSNADSTTRSQYMNITIAVNSSDLYGARMVSVDQQITVNKPTTVTATPAEPYTCTIFRGKDTNYTMWFDKCQLSQLGQDLNYATRNLNCLNTQSALSWTSGVGNQYSNGVGVIGKVDLNKAVVTDMYPMTTGPAAGGAIFWQKNLYTDTYSISLTPQSIYAATNGWLNMSLGCFAYKNTTNSYFRDYITFAQPGVDLDIDPSPISCTRHHYVAASGTPVQFYCVVQQPFYRGEASVAWEIWQASKDGGPYTIVKVATQADVNSRGWGKVVQVVDPTTTVTTVGGAQQRQVGTGLNVTIDSTSTVYWRFRLIATFPGASASNSDYFSVATSVGTGLGGSGPKPGPQTGAAKAGAAEIFKSCLLLVALVAGIAVLFPRF